MTEWIYDDKNHFGVALTQFDTLGLGYDVKV